MPRLSRLLRRANVARLATLLLALWKLARHRDTPRAAKWVALFTLAYALSPIDLIPDFVPVLGVLDDIVLVPLGITLAMKLTPPELWQACLREAEAGTERLPNLRWGIAIVAVIWLLVLALLVWGLYTAFAA
jgi:uncharacterized membrane protein YkvA (DUF1232 family)